MAATRATAMDRLGPAVAALETIRLDLLRLHAGSDGAGYITANVEAATEPASAIEFGLVSRALVERLLSHLGDWPQARSRRYLT